MGIFCKETACTRCAHAPVCAYKKQFIAAQEAVDNLEFSIPNESLDGFISLAKLCNTPWISATLACANFLYDKKSPITRKSDTFRE